MSSPLAPSLRGKHRRIVKATIGGALLLIVYAAIQLGFTITGDLQKNYAPAAPGRYRVLQVYDGDTFTVAMAGREQEVRLVGVDTPETHHPDKPVQCYGPKASEFVTHLIEGKTVRLEADAQQPNRDQYDRLLRYVHLNNGQELNQLLVKKGYAFATDFNTEKEQLLKRLQREARSQNRGLWAECQVNTRSGYLQTNPV